jgi:hypothetical protein
MNEYEGFVQLPISVRVRHVGMNVSTPVRRATPGDSPTTGTGHEVGTGRRSGTSDVAHTLGHRRSVPGVLARVHRRQRV